MLNILLVKETKAGERRVALVPQDVKKLVENGHRVFVENEAGVAAGFTNPDYEAAGAVIRETPQENVESFQALFLGVNIVVRAKRAKREREMLENKALIQQTIMIGALDPFEKNSPHMDELKQAGVKAFSLDQFNFAADDPKNILTAMSKIAGKLALEDAVEKHKATVSEVLILGFGVVGQSAFKRAIERQYKTTVMLRNKQKAAMIEELGGETVLFDSQHNEKQRQDLILQTAKNADVIVTSIRKAKETAPILIAKAGISHLKPGAIIVDMAISEGGNVEGSQHDATIDLGNNVSVTNVSGYPKAVPHEASKLWSRASYYFIDFLISEDECF